ncbi:MAG: inositol monophosphatase family protein [Acidobacteriota bacterium]|nr:inositol monophosphatase family protein [Acidobacteriota bacterium]
MLFHDPDSFLDEVEDIARLGGERLMAHWRSLEAHQISEKARNDFVSAADLASEETILEAVATRFPGHRVLAEESGYSSSDNSAPTWIVDPLDGTTNFVHGIPQFAVSIGVAIEGQVQFGVIFDPCKNDLFTAARGHGARWNGAPCRVSNRTGLEGSLIATGFPFKAHRLLDPYLAIFKDVFLRCKAIRRPGAAALDLAYTACGLFDGFFEFQLSAWDVAAGSVLVEEAGGIITDMDGGADHLSNGNVVCGPRGVQEELLSIVAGHRSAWRSALDS